MKDAEYVVPEKLAIGMFVMLELSWLKHPFSFSSFVIENEDQLATLRGLGLKQIRVDPLRSKLVVAAAEVAMPDEVEPQVEVESAPVGVPAVVGGKVSSKERSEALRSSIANAEKQAAKAARTVRQATSKLVSQPAQAIGMANDLVAGIAESLLGSSEVMVHLLGDKGDGDEVYHHSLSVAVLALILGKAMEVDADTLRTIGLAAVFHDVGMADTPSRVLSKTGPLTDGEQALIRQHCEAGARMALRCGLPEAVATAILQHHERVDGSGYPYRLSGDEIGQVARVIAIVNHYDHLCNPSNVATALTPYEALSTMFARQKNWFDAAMLARLVRVLGVYPPGSIVQLSSGATAMVVSVNSARPLQPMLLVYDAAIPKSEALILDLEKRPEISISKALRAGSLAPAVHEYLSPRRRVAYYFGEDAGTD